MTETACPECGKDAFQSEKAMKIHYGKAHDGTIAGVEQSCTNCGETLRARKSRVESIERPFCSPSCQSEWRSENFHGENNSAWKGGKIEASCAICGAGVERIPANYNEYDRFFCSEECKGQWFSENRTGEDHHNHKDPLQVSCENCGSSLTRYPRDSRYERHYCDIGCFKEHNRGQNHPAWESDSEHDYSGEWNSVREEVLSRDGYECQRCGLSNQEHRERFNSSLHVHHILPIRLFADPGNAHTTENLVSLCCRCHRQVEM